MTSVGGVKEALNLLILVSLSGLHVVGYFFILFSF